VLALLPLFALVGLILAFGNSFPEWGWRRSFLRATVAVGAYTILATEALGLLRGITPLGLFLVWSVPAIGVWGRLLHGSRRGRPVRLPEIRLPLSWLDRVLLLCVVAIMAITAFVAWVAPPNTWDSLSYHMSRVAHWAQDGSLGPYATGIERQNFMSPGAEMDVLHLYVLSGSDRLANFVEWSAMVASLVGVALIACQLGASGTGQLFAVVFAATLPMGIAQASSTMTDYVVALWVVAVASESVAIAGERDPDKAAIFASIAAGLAVVTKPTSLAYLAPFGIWIAWALIRRLGLGALLRLAGVAILSVSILSAGYFGRNFVLEGTPAGGRGLTGLAVSEVLSWQGVVSNLLRNASLHVGTPWPTLNAELYLALAKVHVKLGLPDMDDPKFSRHDVFLIRGTNMEENRTPNTQHAVLLVLSYPVVLASGRRARRPVTAYALAVAATFLLFSMVFKFDLLGSRYHLPFFVLAAPAVGAIVGQPIPAAVGRGIGILLVVLSWSWLVGIENRQLLAAPNRPVTLLNAPREQMYLPDGGMDSFRAVATSIQGAQCEAVGVMFCGDCAEYLLWVVLGAPRDDLRIEWIVAGTPSERYSDLTFRPCAVVCDRSCPGDWTEIRGLPLSMERSGLRLFMETSKNMILP